jgi:hypothetical protein
MTKFSSYIYICIYIYRVRPFHRLRFMSWFSPEIFRGIIDITLFDKRLSVDCGMLTVFFMYFSSIDSVWHTCSILFFFANVAYVCSEPSCIWVRDIDFAFFGKCSDSVAFFVFHFTLRCKFYVDSLSCSFISLYPYPSY